MTALFPLDDIRELDQCYPIKLFLFTAIEAEVKVVRDREGGSASSIPDGAAGPVCGRYLQPHITLVRVNGQGWSEVATWSC